MNSLPKLDGLDALVQTALRNPRPPRPATGFHARLYSLVHPLLAERWSVPKVVAFLVENKRIGPASVKTVTAGLNYHWRKDRLANGQGKLRQRQPKTTTSPAP